MPLFLALLLLASPVPPLSAEQQVAVRDGAIDDRDGPDSALFALVENIRAWPADPDRSDVLVEPDWDRLIDDPDAARGRRIRFSGIVQQVAPGPSPEIREVFVRGDDGQAILVFAIDGEPTEGRRVRVDGRFHRRTRAVGRDGDEHAYPTVVARLAAVTRVAAPGAPLALLVVLVVAGAIILLLLRRAVRTPSRAVIPVTRDPDDELDDGVTLPDDPVSALSELKRRADT